MVSCAHTVVVCVDGGGTPDKHGALKVLFQYLLFSGQLAHTVVLCAHTVVVCVVVGGGPLINMGPSKLFCTSVLRSINPHRGCLYCGGGTPDKHGALKVVFQYYFQVN